MSVIVKKVDVNVDPLLFGEAARELNFKVGHGTAYDYYGNIAEVNCETIVAIPNKKMNIGVKNGTLIYDHMLGSTLGRIMARYHEKNIERHIPRSLLKSKVDDGRTVTIVMRAR